ncbi:hypothetical protein T06_4441 [Trichinella sp. T6]|nr:hypothetical protein T06_4441 [Trichinella sp. T6]
MVILQTFNKLDVFLLRCTPHCSVHHTDDLTLPPVALQKGKRDAQVQFRGRRHTRMVYGATHPNGSKTFAARLTN